jgi:polyisoprenoid-binding protein YceI
MKTILFSLTLLAALNTSHAQMVFKVVPGHADTKVQFTSEAPMETVTGTTHTATGFVEMDPSGTGEGARGEVHADLASLKTGIDLRDRHMRENHLETGKYPEAVFTLTSLTLPSGGLPEGIRTRVAAQGTFKLHGIERTIEPETYFTLHNSATGSTLQIESNFTVRLPDYLIKRPQFLLMRLAEEQRVHVELHAVAGTGVAADTK